MGRDYYYVHQVKANGYLVKFKGLTLKKTIQLLKKNNINCDNISLLFYNQDCTTDDEKDLKIVIFIGEVKFGLELELVGDYEILNSWYQFTYEQTNDIVQDENKILNIQDTLKSIFGDHLKKFEEGKFNILATRVSDVIDYDS